MHPISTALLALVFAPSAFVPAQSAADPAPDDRAAHTAPAAPAERLQWGLYQIYWSHHYGERLTAELSRFASRPDYVMFYRDLGRSFPRRGIDAVHSAGAVPIISLELGNWHQPKEKFLPRIVAGEFDDAFTKWAKDAAADSRRVLLRFGFEANGDWFSWGGQPDLYVAAWRRVHALFSEAGADNVKWVWSPNVVSIPRTKENDLHHYYPGDDVVDWLGLDGYNFGEDYDQWHGWESFEQIFGKVVADLAQRHPDKPIMIAETGSAPGAPGRKAEWIREAFASARKLPNVKAVIWFNYDKRRGGELDWRVGSSADSLAAFNATFAAPGIAAEQGSDPRR